MWLKRSTPQNIVIGGAAGAVPPMIGWAAATGTVSLESFILFLIIFVWTPPHFWALALVRVRDYERAGVPMLPVVHGEDETRRQILIYSLILAPLGCVPAFSVLAAGSTPLPQASSARSSSCSPMPATPSGLGAEAERAAKNLFAYSVLYLFLLFAALLVEQGFGLGHSSDPAALDLVMTDEEDERQRRQRMRSIAIAWALAALSSCSSWSPSSGLAPMSPIPSSSEPA